jgi:hypothetical protein
MVYDVVLKVVDKMVLIAAAVVVAHVTIHP